MVVGKSSREYFMFLPDMEHWCSVLGIILLPLLVLAPLLLEGAPQGAVDGNKRQFYMYRLDLFQKSDKGGRTHKEKSWGVT